MRNNGRNGGWIVGLVLLTLTQTGCQFTFSYNWSSRGGIDNVQYGPLGPQAPGTQLASQGAPPATPPPAARPAAPVNNGPTAPVTTTAAIPTAPANGAPVEQPVNADLGPVGVTELQMARVEMPEVFYRTGEGFERPMSLTSDAPLERMTFEIEYDAEACEYVEFVAGNALPAGSVVTRVTPGKLSFEVTGRGQRETATALGTMKFLSKALPKDPRKFMTVRVTSVKFARNRPA